jgi:hypothetical protein
MFSIFGASSEFKKDVRAIARSAQSARSVRV